MKTEVKKLYSLNEQGKRNNNEDNIYPNSNIEHPFPGLYIVCDGMGGRESGEIASEIACSQFARFFAENPIDVSDAEYLKKALQYVENDIDEYLLEHPSSKGMGTTLALLHFHSEGVTLAHIGDSRIYHLRDGEILFCTEDHSIVMQLVKSGIITADEARTHEKKNQINRAIQGSGEKATTPDVKIITDIKKGDIFFMCTDGILESFDDKDLVDTIFHNETDEAAISLINQICSVNSDDNFSALLIPLTDVIIEEKEALPPIEQPRQEDIPQKLPTEEPLSEEIEAKTVSAFPNTKVTKLKSEKKRRVFTMRYFWIGLIFICLLGLMFGLKPWNWKSNSHNGTRIKKEAPHKSTKTIPVPSEKAANKESITWIPYKDKNGKWGFKNGEEIVIKGKYDSIIGDYTGKIITKVDNGKREKYRTVNACVLLDGKYYLIDTEKNEFVFDKAKDSILKSNLFLQH